MEAAVHPRQGERLRALYSYEILDTDREKEFDDVVKLAAEICGTAISVINLIDSERQWFKAEVGLGVRETPLATSICSHVILENEFVEINDTLKDPRMLDNPLCCGEPGLRFYAGALLTSDDGLPIGTLCVLDWEPKALTPLQRDTLRVLARQVMAQLDLRRALRLAETLRQEVDHRVKNSLQSLSALSYLQARSTKSEEVRAALELMQRRIQTVSMLHEQLYKTEAGSKIDLGEYVRNVGNFLSDVAPGHVAVETDVQPVIVSSQQAASVGILLNELATNAFKHAFPEDRQGTVRLSLKRLEDGLVSVECTDNGVGLEEGTAKPNGGLGMKIAEAITRQLGGSLAIDRSKCGGVTAGLVFPPAAEAGVSV
jgi:two-component sensor histidine kinase